MSLLRVLLGRVAVSIGALAMIGLLVAPAQAQLDDVECSAGYAVNNLQSAEEAQEGAKNECLTAPLVPKPGPFWEIEVRLKPFFGSESYTGYWVDKTPEVDPINVEEDLLSFARWKTDEGGINESTTALYTLTKGAADCQNFYGNDGTYLRFKNQLSTAVCQIGEVTGKETNSVWDRTVKLKWKTPEACKANTVLFFGGEQAKLNTNDVECDNSRLRNYEIPDKATLAGQANGGKIAVKLGMDIGDGDQSQDFIIGYWTPAASSTLDCSDESIDWTTAATEEGWSCTVDGNSYEYLDFHVIKKMAAYKEKTCESFLDAGTGDMNYIKACASASDGSDVYFYLLGTWENNRNKAFPWVDGFTQFGLNFYTGQRN
ncbi:MAG: hypothetical protein P8M13_09005, partial [Luminiphilus sp.]|nr:hypothetical protein [Luminiphilus sp.]